MRMRRWLLSLASLAACGQQPPPKAPAVAACPAPKVAPAQAAQAARAAAEKAAQLPDCTERGAEQRGHEVEEIAAHLAAPNADPRAIVAELRALLARGCMRYVRPAFEFPSRPTIEGLRAAFAWGVDFSLTEAAGGLVRKRDRPVQVIPPSLMPDLTDGAAAEVARVRCAPGDGSCAAAQSYILRAEQAFDARYSEAQADIANRPEVSGEVYPEIKEKVCTDWLIEPEERPTTYESWVSCVTARAPTNLRFAERDLRAPAQGWLLLQGSRGHYDVSDEIRAYDLSTGAAYVVSDRGGLVPPSAQAGLASYAGRVDPAHVREVAFMLTARPALVEVRTATTYAVPPAKIPRGLTDDGSFTPQSDFPRSSWRSSDQTEISFVYSTAGERFSGTFTWPASADRAETYIVDLVQIMEAGLVRGCAPAKPPPDDVLGVDVAKTSATVVKAFAGVRAQACKGAR